MQEFCWTAILPTEYDVGPHGSLALYPWLMGQYKQLTLCIGIGNGPMRVLVWQFFQADSSLLAMSVQLHHGPMQAFRLHCPREDTEGCRI